MDYSLAVYGCPPKGIATFDFDQSKVIAPQLAALLPHLQKMPPASRVLVAYRNDHYFYRLQPAVSKLLSMISGMRSERREIYRNREFVLLIFQPSPAEPPRS
jgi:hypothetical protein